MLSEIEKLELKMYKMEQVLKIYHDALTFYADRDGKGKAYIKRNLHEMAKDALSQGDMWR